MENALTEFIVAVKGSTVLCAEIVLKKGYDDWAEINLKVGYTEEEYESFLKSLDSDYDSGYGGQELAGCVWLENGAWLERGEYDGSEWWDYKSTPQIPDNLK
jgi:hypothetical protein